jgi:hypothetical protein
MSFIKQIENRRIKTLGQDIFEDVNSTGQQWDTFGDSEAVIFGDDYWDVNMRLIKTNDVIKVRYHDPDTDDILGNWNVLVGYAKGLSKDIPDFTYKSKLLKVISGYNTLEIRDVKRLTSATSFTMKTSPASILAGLYAFVNGKTVSAGATVKLRNAADSADLATLSIPAGASYGSYASATAGFAAVAAASYKLNVVAGAGESGNFDLHIVAVWA